MKKILDSLKWIIGCQCLGIICTFTAYFIPGDPIGGFKNGLFLFGMVLTLGLTFQLYPNVYKPLKKESDKEK